MKLIDEILRERITEIADEFNKDDSRPFKLNNAGIESLLLKAKEKLINNLLSDITEGQLTVAAFKTKDMRASRGFKEDLAPMTPEQRSNASEAAQKPNRAKFSDIEEFNHEWGKLPDPIKGRTTKMSAHLTAKFRTRMKDEFFRENWKEALHAMATDPHCLGQNTMKWVADKAYFLKPETIERLLNRKDQRQSESPKSEIPNQFK